MGGFLLLLDNSESYNSYCHLCKLYDKNTKSFYLTFQSVFGIIKV
nr:MAG TPA: hypothetical protein [Caudoviricetes sp.]